MPSSEIKTVAVLGAGTMGNGIAHVFARSGYDVILRDVEQRFLDRGLETIAKNLDREVKKSKISEAEKSAALARIHPVTDTAGARRRRFRRRGGSRAARSESARAERSRRAFCVPA